MPARLGSGRRVVPSSDLAKVGRNGWPDVDGVVAGASKEPPRPECGSRRGGSACIGLQAVSRQPNLASGKIDVN
jgi:hypothetical protein